MVRSREGIGLSMSHNFVVYLSALSHCLGFVKHRYDLSLGVPVPEGKVKNGLKMLIKHAMQSSVSIGYGALPQQLALSQNDVRISLSRARSG